MKGILYIVSTPIGNLEDITMRAVRVLREVDVIAAEDTRHSKKLLNHFAISKPLISYWGEREKVKSAAVLDRLRAGESVALVSDAGTPGISDPGGVLVREALNEGFRVIPVPGPSAFVAALSVSGLPSDEFCFSGFLPARRAQRQRFLRELATDRRTLVFYEAPHRIVQSAEDMAEIFGKDRRAFLARELTKLFEETVRGTLADIVNYFENSVIAGEYVLVVEGSPARSAVNLDDAVNEVPMLMKKGMGRKEAVKKLADEYGLSKKELYDRSLAAETGEGQ